MQSFNLRDAGLSCMGASGPCQSLLVPVILLPHLVGYTFRIEETGIDSGEEGGLPTIQSERPVQRKVAVVDALRGILFDNL